MLTDKAVRAANGKDKAYKLTDGGGLYLYVTPKNHKSWRYKYRQDGKDYLLTLGSYPEVSLADAREKRNEAKRVKREGRDPRHAAKRTKLLGLHNDMPSLEVAAREWHDLNTGRWKPVHANDVITSLERDIFPDLGDLPVDFR